MNSMGRTEVRRSYTLGAHSNIESERVGGIEEKLEPLLLEVERRERNR